MSLIDNFGLGAVEAGGEAKCLEDGSVVECDDAPERLSEILDGFTCDDDVPFATLLAKTGMDESRRERVKSYVEGFNAANAGIVSSAALKRQQQAEDAIQGETMFRVGGGYSGIPQRLYSTLDRPADTVLLNWTVTAVNWRNGGASVEMVNTAGGWKSAIECRRVLVTVPAGVLQSDAIRFNPEPADLHEAMARLAVGEVARVTLRFRHRFWEDNAQFGSLGFLFATGEDFPTWWTQNPARAPVLTAWAGGPRAQALLARGCVVEQALECCARVFGTQMGVVRDELITSYFHDWHTDPFARGAYTYIRSGALGAVERLARPFGDALHFAGEATDTTGHWGTVHGALASGERAAEQILRAG
jgi:monoamine oxidase